jgi:hypothetical protein
MPTIRRFQVPRYSLTANIVGVACIVAISLAVVGWKLHGTNVRETLAAVAVAFVIFWSYFSCILYRGLRFDNGVVRWRRPSLEWPDVGGQVDFSQLDLGSIDGEGCFGVIIGVVVSIVALVTLVILIWLGVEIGLFLSLVIVVPVYWLFRLSARLVIVNTRTCAGNPGSSMRWAARYAFIYALVVGAVFFAINGLASLLQGHH